MIYVRDNVVQNDGLYRENKPRQGEPDPDAKLRCLASPCRVLLSIMTGVVQYIIPLNTQLPAKTKQYLHTVCRFTSTICSVDQHRRWRLWSSVGIKVQTDQLQTTAAADAVSLIKCSRTHPKLIGKCIHVDYSRLHHLFPIEAYIYSFFI